MNADPPALERARSLYVAGRITLEVLEARIAYLLANGLEDSRSLVAYEVPEPGGLPPAPRKPAEPTYRYGPL